MEFEESLFRCLRNAEGQTDCIKCSDGRTTNLLAGSKVEHCVCSLAVFKRSTTGLEVKNCQRVLLECWACLFLFVLHFRDAFAQGEAGFIEQDGACTECLVGLTCPTDSLESERPVANVSPKTPAAVSPRGQ